MTRLARRNFDTDIRSQACYPVAEAARYLRLPAATLRSWAWGREYETTRGARHFPAIIKPASRKPPLLSFWNLIEAHVLRSLRLNHAVSVQAVRKALEFAQKELNVDRLLLSPELRSSAGELFLDHYGELIQVSASGQIAMRQVMLQHLDRVEWDEWKFPVRLFPFQASLEPGSSRFIAIDPAIAFGRPILVERGIATEIIVDRIDAGESVADVAADYDLSAADVEQAILYERAA